MNPDDSDLVQTINASFGAGCSCRSGSSKGFPHAPPLMLYYSFCNCANRFKCTQESEKLIHQEICRICPNSDSYRLSNRDNAHELSVRRMFQVPDVWLKALKTKKKVSLMAYGLRSTFLVHSRWILHSWYYIYSISQCMRSYPKASLQPLLKLWFNLKLARLSSKPFHCVLKEGLQVVPWDMWALLLPARLALRHGFRPY